MEKSATHNHLSWLLLFFLTQLHLTWQQGVKSKGMFEARSRSVTLWMIFLHHHQSRISDSLVLHVSKGQQQVVHGHLYKNTLFFTMTVLRYRYRVSFDITVWLAGDSEWLPIWELWCEHTSTFCPKKSALWNLHSHCVLSSPHCAMQTCGGSSPKSSSSSTWLPWGERFHWLEPEILREVQSNTVNPWKPLSIGYSIGL